MMITLGDKISSVEMFKPRELKEVVIKPWGKYENLYVGEFKVKILTLNPKSRISLQRHRWREEHWIVVEGAANVFKDGATFKLYPTDSINIGIGQWHRLENNYNVPLVVVEVQKGDCFEEDIERKEDDYGRGD